MFQSRLSSSREFYLFKRYNLGQYHSSIPLSCLIDRTVVVVTAFGKAGPEYH